VPWQGFPSLFGVQIQRLPQMGRFLRICHESSQHKGFCPQLIPSRVTTKACVLDRS